MQCHCQFGLFPCNKVIVKLNYCAMPLALNTSGTQVEIKNHCQYLCIVV